MRWIIFIVIYILIDLYAFQAIRTLTRNPWINGAYIFFSLAVLAALIYQLNFSGSPRLMAPGSMYIFGFFLAFLVPKIILVVFMFGEDIIRLFVGLFSKVGGGDEGFYMPSRRKFLSTLALGIAAIPFASLLYGMYRGKYNYKVLKYALEFDDLPEAFDGYTITQLSDIHSGSFDNHKMVKYAVNLVNEQHSDVILFTGDLVNNVAEEMLDWKDLFGSLKAKDGVFSVLGNHDYGDYVAWNSTSEKEENLERLKELQKRMGWELLLNEHRFIERNGEKIALIGVENWGEGGFKKAGDLNKACAGLSKGDFKILMSHDPSHWKAQVKEDERHFQLTLSGHTHGMQFGIEIPGWFKWSPVKYRYENWAGIYKEFGRYINVNRGFGYLGYPGRVGIWPEITVIRLKKSANTA
ncbi:metallophosphoesterase [Constantimarinum furrinae]|uniref:Phosphohydrolase n=1 Tax=Constantimarinum furrinae TaxID=2562285 RepID=A0A7G8PTV6_9FLAO|nr:metallophosphoesterase [Constantimarinum furrinae]QNJ97772.1 Putative phosphohydrolase [Constantimarinum furrinae]